LLAFGPSFPATLPRELEEVVVHLLSTLAAVLRRLLDRRRPADRPAWAEIIRVKAGL